MRCTSRESCDSLNVLVNGELVEEVESVVAANGGVEADVYQTVNEECKVLDAVTGVLRNQALGMNVKRVLYEKVIVPVEMRGSELWGMKVTETELNMFEMKCLRSIAGVFQLDRFRNKVARVRTGVRNILPVAGRVHMNVLRWLGHVEKMVNGCLLKVMNAINYQ
ncbi:uncharacterized protein [Palaemon carinicauda]|uniref:uncharacterized protein n=1 Tax=Palaemon carinicauda TaxID=392227 RepID=UPI0035B634E5